MKRLFLCICTLFFLAVLTVGASAQTITLEDADLTIALPEGYTAFYHGMDPNDAVFQQSDLTPDEIDASLDADGSACYAFDGTGSHAFSISFRPSEDTLDYQLYGSNWLEASRAAHAFQFESFSAQPVESEIYLHPQAVFLVASFSYLDEDQSPAYAVCYSTVYGGIVYDIFLHSYDAPFTQEELAPLTAMIDSLVFPGPAQTMADLPQSEPFSYTDPAFGISFTVPANWRTSDDTGSEEWEGHQVKFVSNFDDFSTIDYLAIDFMTFADSPSLDISRSDAEQLDIRDLPFDDMLMETYGAGQTFLDRAQVTYGTTVYERFTISIPVEEDGLTAEQFVTFLFCLEHGCMHGFLYSGTIEDPLYQDFLSLVTSAEFSAPVQDEAAPVQDEAPPAPAPTMADTPQSASPTVSFGSRLLFKFIGGCLSGAAAYLLTWLFRRGRKKRSAPPAPADGVHVCPHCGAQLNAVYLFCPKCGKKIQGSQEDST